MHESSMSVVLQGLLDRLKAGDEKARDELIGHAYDRLVILSRRMLGRYSRLKAWEQTDDIAQSSMMRLRRALQDVKPASVRDFIGLASEQIRRELLDVNRHYFGREGGSNEAGGGSAKPRAARAFSQQTNAAEDSRQPTSQDPGSDTYDPANLAIWREFHEQVQLLVDQEREIVELLWYQELTQEEAAQILGVDKSTVKRRWRSARSNLSTALKGWLPMAANTPENPSAS